MHRYYSLQQEGDTTEIYIYGEITSNRRRVEDVSSTSLLKELEGMEAKEIDVYINSFGGEVSESLAIYNQLRRSGARVRTICDGFACSGASVVFMAGKERLMQPASLLMVHNAWTWAEGDPGGLRKAAEDLDVVNSASVEAYLSGVTIPENRLRELMERETWISPEQAVEMGFATGIAKLTAAGVPVQSARQSMMGRMLAKPSAAVQIDGEEIAELTAKKLLERLEQRACPKTRGPMDFLDALMRGKE